MKNLAIGASAVAVATFLDNTQTPPVTTPLDQPAVWSVDNPAAASVTVIDDGTAGHGDGVSTATVTALADGPFTVSSTGVSNGRSIPGTLPGNVGGDNAVNMTWQDGTPVAAKK